MKISLRWIRLIFIGLIIALCLGIYYYLRWLGSIGWTPLGVFGLIAGLILIPLMVIAVAILIVALIVSYT